MSYISKSKKPRTSRFSPWDAVALQLSLAWISCEDTICPQNDSTLKKKLKQILKPPIFQTFKSLLFQKPFSDDPLKWRKNTRKIEDGIAERWKLCTNVTAIRSFFLQKNYFDFLIFLAYIAFSRSNFYYFDINEIWALEFGSWVWGSIPLQSNGGMQEGERSFKPPWFSPESKNL